MKAFKLSLLGLWVTSLFGLNATTTAGDLWTAHVIENIQGGGPDGTRLADVNGDGHMDVAVPYEYFESTMVHINPGPATVKDGNPWLAVQVQDQWGGSEDAVFGDFDGDGQMDVLTSLEPDTNRLVISFAPRNPADYLNPALWESHEFPVPEVATDGGWIYSLPGDIDGDGDLDIVAGGKGNHELAWLENPGPATARDLSTWTYHKLCNVRWIMSLQWHDFNGDGLDDLFVTDRNYGLDTNTPGGVVWLEHPGRGNESGAWTIHKIRQEQALFSAVEDFSGDGLADVLVAGNGQLLTWYEQGPADADGIPSWTEHIVVYPNMEHKTKAVRATDIDLDGTMELVVTSESTKIDGDGPREPWNRDKANFFYLKPVNGIYGEEWTRHEISGDVGKLDLIVLYDFDGDGDEDVMTTDESGPGVMWWENPTISGVEPPAPEPVTGLLIYEPFDYDSGNLDGKNGGGGGIGWSLPWSATGTDGGFGAGARPLATPGLDPLVTSGNHYLHDTSNGVTSSRQFARIISDADVEGDSIWVSFLVGTTTHFPQKFNILIADAGGDRGAEITRENGGWRLRTNTADNTSFGNGSMTVGGAMDLIVLNFDYSDGGDISAWINPDLSASTTEPTNAAFQLDLGWTPEGIAAIQAILDAPSGGTLYLDEFRVSDSFETAVLGGSGGATVLF